jgi:hypothetical protein
MPPRKAIRIQPGITQRMSAGHDDGMIRGDVGPR